MKRGDCEYIWQAGDWPAWRFDLAALAEPMAQVSRAQGLLLGRLADVGMALRNQASLAHQLRDALKSGHSERIAHLARLLFENDPGSPQHSSLGT